MFSSNGIAVLSSLLLWIMITINRANTLEYYTEQPAFLPSCKINEPEFVKCSTNTIQKLMDQLSIGIPEIIEKIGTFDPMIVGEIDFKQDSNEAVSLNAKLTNLTATGFSKLKIKESKVSKKNYSWETKIYIPTMRLDGMYKMDGRILLIPLKGSGKMFIEIDDMNLIMSTKTRLYEKGGFTFYNLTSLRVNLMPGRVRVNFDNIFNGNSKEVEKSTNQFFNDNWRDFFEALRPLVSETVERIMLNLMQEVFTLIPANFFIEDIPTSDKLYGTSKV